MCVCVHILSICESCLEYTITSVHVTSQVSSSSEEPVDLEDLERQEDRKRKVGQMQTDIDQLKVCVCVCVCVCVFVFVFV